MLRAGWHGPHAHRIRQGLGVIVGLTALAIALNVDRHFQTAIPGYTEALQNQVERSDRAQRELRKVRGIARDEPADSSLRDFGAAPEVAGLTNWINSEPLTLRRLRGKVVLIDFWTYSCINCLRTLPHVKAWDRTYRPRGLVVLGVHSPEFAFEHVPGNVRSAVRRLGIDYPVALDNRFATWRAFRNEGWPSKFLIDRRGHVRYSHLGEGEYDTTEERIRDLLGESPELLPVANRLSDRTPRAPLTPESYLGYERLARTDQFDQVDRGRDRFALYKFPQREFVQDELAYDGTWKVGPEEITAGLGARLQLQFTARTVHLVLGGDGPVEVFLDGKRRGAVQVKGSKLYTLLRLRELHSGLLELRFAPGVTGYAFTFG